MVALMQALLIWAAAATGLPPTTHLPEVQYKTLEQLHYIAYGPEVPYDGDPNKGVQALYMPGLVLLPKDFDPANPVSVVILGHELVHHLQEEAGKTYPCRGAKEKPAYDFERQMVKAFGLDMERDLHTNELFLLLVTSCNLYGGDGSGP